VPTAYGGLLVEHAKAVINAASRARDELHAFRDARGGSVTIGVGETFAPEIVAEAVRDFHNERPDVKITLFEGYSEHLLGRLRSGAIDFIAGADIGELSGEVLRLPLYVARDIVIARAEHPLTRRRKLSLKDLLPYTWMAPYSRPADATIIAEAFSNANLPAPQRFIWTDALSVGLHLLLLDDYLVLTAPALVAGPLMKLKAVVALDIRQPTVERRAGLLYTTRTSLNPSAMSLMETVQRIARRHVSEMEYAVSLEDASGRPRR
jgi:LysR family transcriptional regulator of gallate degradation